MGNEEAEQLGRFRQQLEALDDRRLLRIITGVVDDCVDLLRAVPGGARLPVEMAAAISAELHRRTDPKPPTPTRSSLVGNA